MVAVFLAVVLPVCSEVPEVPEAVLVGLDYHPPVVILTPILFLKTKLGRYLIASKLRIPEHFSRGFLVLVYLSWRWYFGRI
jgi:hypothetical protein